jgi:hypothetical protein
MRQTLPSRRVDFLEFVQALDALETKGALTLHVLLKGDFAEYLFLFSYA